MVFAGEFKTQEQQLKFAHRLGAGLDMDDAQLLKLLQKKVSPHVTYEVMKSLRVGYHTDKRTPIQFECFSYLATALPCEAFCLTREVRGKPRRYQITLREYQQIAQRLTSLIWRSRDKVAEVRRSYFIPSREKTPATPAEEIDWQDEEQIKQFYEDNRKRNAEKKNPTTADAGYKKKTGRGIRDPHKLGFILDNLVAANVFRRFAARGCPTRYALGKNNPFYLLADVPDAPDTPVVDNPWSSTTPPPNSPAPATEIVPPPHTLDAEEVNNIMESYIKQIEQLQAQVEQLQEERLSQARTINTLKRELEEQRRSHRQPRQQTEAKLDYVPVSEELGVKNDESIFGAVDW